ncbi:MAG TPA: acyl-CoA dehydratase activase [Spirochaetota bacterium]|nr:acyl-CoA dehydratase activase [Spirochaetota bacterium]HPU89563.1 acyl-CoA dehydratase activase [Spirochaetota bacterium]
MMAQRETHTACTGIEIGAVSVKWVLDGADGTTAVTHRHEGDPRTKLRELFADESPGGNQRYVVTGQTARQLLDLPYRPETECLERALAHHGILPDILLSLGGETFTVYTLRSGVVKNVLSTTKCAAGTGEFIVQQLQRMDYSLEEGIAASASGTRVDLATRCSVHCKSDSTHKLNKGECTREDIVRSLIEDLARKVCRMIDQAQWPAGTIVISGGVSLNEPFVSALKEQLPDSEIRILPESPYLEAFGAYLLCRDHDGVDAVVPPDRRIRETHITYTQLRPLRESEGLLDYRVVSAEDRRIIDGDPYVLAVDAGSTTTKAVLYNSADGSIGAACYLRTHGNPVDAARRCLEELTRLTEGRSVRIIQAATTGSGREMVSVYLNNCLAFNEILAHARAASAEVGGVDTVFEIGGQDAKYISFIDGVPVDYGMNEGCSAGTGSFLEESISVDMNIPVHEISGRAIASDRPISFGERCAAFINTDLRNALQQGAARDDVIAGLVYSIVDNYISRIVGIRPIGETVLFQGGVALNRAVALAMAARSGRRIIVPRHPELMGCVGAALMASERVSRGEIPETNLSLSEMAQTSITTGAPFTCAACENRCEIKRIIVRDTTYPFGGLCSLYENKRHASTARDTAKDFVSLRNRLMFEEFAPPPLERPRGTIGIPLALSTYEYFPYYAALAHELGFNITLSSENRAGNQKTMGDICYPCEIVHGAVDDLLRAGVDYILLPHVIEAAIPEGYLHSYLCINTGTIANIVMAAFEGLDDTLLRPHIAFSDHLTATTEQEIVRMGARLGVSKKTAIHAARVARDRQREYCGRYAAMGRSVLEEIGDEPAIIVAGRPYVYGSNEANLALPRKLISRGYHAIPMDLLPPIGDSVYERNVWHYGQQILNAIEHVKRKPSLHICLVSCFSCFPDASIYHLVRTELSGHTFCYLEVDSHTAHAGFETRVGAFLDIIEERERAMRHRAGRTA